MLGRSLALIWTAGWSLAAMAGSWLYYELYWRWRDCFNEEGRCYVADDAVVHHDSNFVLVVLPVACLAVASLGVVAFFLARNRTSKG